MKQTIGHNIQHLVFMAITGLTIALTACNSKSKFNFQTTDEAITACRQELSKITPLKQADISLLVAITNNWMELRDSTMMCFVRDSVTQTDTETVKQFVAVADSFRTEITRLATATPRTMADIVQLKVETAEGRNQLQKSKDYKKACKFYGQMDGTELYPTLKITLLAYDKLLKEADPFQKEGEMLDFIRKEDKCFRSLLTFLRYVPDGKLQEITDRTATLFDNLQQTTAARQGGEAGERVRMYLTMRFNRRIIQNAEMCCNDIGKKEVLTPQQANNYRWMVIQPYMAIDNYAAAALTSQQTETLTEMAEKLPEMLAYIDGKDYDKSPKETTGKLAEILSGYFLTTYLRSIL